MSVSLSPRLNEVYRRLGGCGCLADVGCDHGKLSVKALQEGICDRAIATDISGASLTKAAYLADRCGVELDCRVGDGLKPLVPHEADVVVIAGMGGKEIVDILIEASWRPKRVLLVPHRDAPWVRKYLSLAGYQTKFDTLVKDAGHYYWVIDAALGEEGREVIKEQLALSDAALNWYVGKDAALSPSWEEYRTIRLQKLLKERSLGSRNPSALAEMEYLKQQ